MSAMGGVKILYASDLHGQPERYEGLTEICRALRPDALILGGDLFLDEGTLRPERAGREQPEFVRTYFRDWLESLLAELPALVTGVIFGNHDWLTSARVVESLCDELPLHVLDRWSRPQSDPAKRGVLSLGDLHVVGLSHAPPSPWYVKDFERRDGDFPAECRVAGLRWDESSDTARPIMIERETRSDQSLAAMLAGCPIPPSPWILVAHCPPIQTAIDMNHGGGHIGSIAVRDFIRQHQPLLSLHGHIHESPSVSGSIQDRLGETICINAGQEYGRVRAALIEPGAAGGTALRVTLVSAP